MSQCAKCQIGDCEDCLFYTVDGRDCTCFDCGGAEQLEEKP